MLYFISDYLSYEKQVASNYLPFTTPVIRSFSTLDLLWTESKFIKTRNILIKSEPYKTQNDTRYYSKELSSVPFLILGNDEKEASAFQQVFNFVTPRGANISYSNQFSIQLGEPPENWHYKSMVADQFTFSCFKYPSSEYPDCTWDARYEEFIIEFEIEWVPGVVDLEDIEKMISEVDQIMAEHLQLPLVE